ncbi:YsnF/AvaK domain-containing protein [Halalkalibacter alkalisediminis]|uniref:YsnF/AvaK domain-containing protein n=1 Tax=Halalkalibacter alkalisediminis TaxID=935616 RepID=A0ABV6NFB8_9BACI|nr:YsnF/AvaK domain-containing protein [Halalkalibacter alkalisediminis]
MGKFIFIGAIIGSILGWLMDFSILAGLVLGAIAGGVSYALFSRRNIEKSTDESEVQSLQLKEEQLDIKKERIQTGEVKVHREVVEEEKTFKVPIRREEMVIEAGDEEEIRIPLKEEEIKFSKHPVKLNEVSISKREIEEVEQVRASVKKETAHVEVEGDADVVKEDDEKLQ